MKQRSSDELKMRASAVLCLLKCPKQEFAELGKFFVDIAKTVPPAKAKSQAHQVSADIGLCWEIADGFAKACRYLAILHKYYPKDFAEAIEK
ncbi:MAG: hypothetical protein U9M90_03940 [Patescibacteria group bacterium]|nr:hypothetical protein [Patescibacteria group bacterium]